MSEWLARWVRVPVNFVDRGSIPVGCNFVTPTTLATERGRFTNARLFLPKCGFLEEACWGRFAEMRCPSQRAKNCGDGTHFMRTTPLRKWRKEATKFDQKIWDAAQSILGLPLNEQSWKQACLTPRLGGLGLRRIVDHAEIAFSASWSEAQGTCRENWTVRPDVKWTKSQKYGSFKKDEEILKKLIEQAPSPRERQRLNRLQCEHSGAWICAGPSTHDGNDTVMRPQNFRVAITMRLGLPVLDEEKSCSLCTNH